MKFKRDFIVIASVLVAAAIGLLILFMTRSSGARAVIKVDGKLFGEYSLSENAEIDIAGHNRAVIENGGVHMSQADCPDKLCIKQGVAQETGDAVVCLPNRVIIEIHGAT